MKIIAIIPARGGSKGIPKKNILPISGRPLITYTIEHATHSKTIDRVIVSTDDSEIAAIAKEFGAEVIVRPDEISSDTSSSEEALLHALNHLNLTEQYKPDYVVFLQATSPVRNFDDIDCAVNLLIQENADSLFSACEIEGFTWRKNLQTKRIRTDNYNPEHRPRRQELLDRYFEENGSIYIFKPQILFSMNSRLGGKLAMYQMDKSSSFQIDRIEDVTLIELIIQNKLNRK